MCAYLGHFLGVRRSGIRGDGPEGRSRGSRDEDIAPERRRNAPPDGPGQHGDDGAEESKGATEVMEGTV